MLDPLSSVVIEEIMESLVDSGVPAPKKGQAIPIVEGFAPLIISLPRIVEPSPEFVQKGTPVVRAIQGSDPLNLPKPIQGIFGAPGPKALEAALPSLAPNLQTQEGLVIRMRKPFLYKDNHRVP